MTRKVPAYVWTFLALVAGLAAGGLLPGPLAPVADATSVLIGWVVAILPVTLAMAHTRAVREAIDAGARVLSMTAFTARMMREGGLFTDFCARLLKAPPRVCLSATGASRTTAWAQRANQSPFEYRRAS